VINAASFAVLDAIKWRHTYLVFMIIQCLFIGVWFLIKYHYLYRRLKDYHEDLISANQGHFSE
jgi:hypothetical protein